MEQPISVEPKNNHIGQIIKEKANTLVETSSSEKTSSCSSESYKTSQENKENQLNELKNKFKACINDVIQQKNDEQRNEQLKLAKRFWKSEECLNQSSLERKRTLSDPNLNSR